MGTCENLPGYDSFRFRERCVYHRRPQRSGPPRPVVVVHELPGMTPECVDFANRLAEHGFSPHLPLLFGKPGEQVSATTMARVCISREFRVLASRRTSPAAELLRDLCGEVQRRESVGGAPCAGVGAIGMCLTGGYVLTMMADPAVLAPVLSQPSLPLPVWGPGRARRKAALGIAPEDLEEAKARDVPLLALRFTNDWVCPHERFETLAREFPRLETHPVESPDPENGIGKRAHSVLTAEYGKLEERVRRDPRAIDPDHPLREAFRRVVDFLNTRFEAAEPRSA